MLYNYSVTPLREDHFEERCADIIELHQKKIITMPLFSMTLVPEGNPLWDKAGPMIETFNKYRKALAAAGVPAGILVQASLGHSYAIEPNPFQNYVNLTDGEPQYVCCPEDPRFIEHFQGVLRRLAAAKPAAIMMDDDFRLMVRPGRGCVCPLHLKKFNQRAGLNWSKDELRAHILQAPKEDPLAEHFRLTQRESLIEAAKAFRSAIDEIDPSIQGINCTSGHYCDTVEETNAIFAGKGNPKMVRIPNGIYAPPTLRGFSDLMRQGAICSAKLKKHGIDIILAESDTIPFNRYGRGARHLHAHYTASLMEGAKGSKHWLSRTAAFEPASGKAYRKILGEHIPFYERVAELADEIRWVGCNSAFIEQEKFIFNSPNFRRYHDNDWVICNLERMGIPFYFSETFEGVTFLEGDIIGDMSDAQVEALFKTSLFLDGQAAADLIARGYGDRLGVAISEWGDQRCSGETFDEEAVNRCTAQKQKRRLKLMDPRAKAESFNFATERSGISLLAPAVTSFEREDGKLSVVYCGSPTARFHYTEGFSFLNESRKAQFIRLLQRAGALPVYWVGDEEICLRAGYLADQSLLVAAYNIGADPAEEPILYLQQEPKTIERLGADGQFAPLPFEAIGEHQYRLQYRLETMDPMILKIQ